MVQILGAGQRGEGDFTTRDLEILEVITRQAGIALENSRLIAELHQSHLERAQLHGQVLRAGEKERKKLARELHDRIIQALVGLNYELAEIRRELSPESRALVDRSQSELQSVIGDLRQICAGLRPPALDSLGVVAVMRSLVRSARSKAPFQTSFEVDGDGSQELSEEIILCLYRALARSAAQCAETCQCDPRERPVIDRQRGCAAYGRG